MADISIKTENIYDYTAQDTTKGYVDNAYINQYGETISENVYAVSEYIEITGQHMSLSVPVSLNSPSICFYDSEKHYISGAKYNLRSTVTENIPQNAIYMRFTIVKQYASTTMVNLGNTLLPFTPCWLHSLRKLGTATETIQSGDTIYADGTAATVSLKGNTVQNGTPTPQNPVMPNGVGERTAQLFDYQSGTPTPYKYLDENGNEIEVAETAPWYITDYIPVPDGVLSVTLSKIGGGSPAMCAYDASKNYITGIKYDTGSAVTKVDITLTSLTPIRFIRFSYFLGNTGYDDISTKMLNTGSTAKPYEPYGYKIPISCGGTTNNVYLGEVQTTRQIRKLVLTGEESFTKNDGQSTNYLYYANRGVILPSSIGKTPILCNELPAKSDTPQSVIGINTDNRSSVVYFNFGADVMNVQTSGNTVAGLKEYLASQYANGTPVTIWYVLANETTAITNEPLMRIGDYADSLTTSVSCTAGENSLDVDTTVQPSEVTATFEGWHPVSAAHERENGQWD